MQIYYRSLKLQLEGTYEPIEIEAGLVDSPGVGALLGQTGFLNTSASALTAVGRKSKSAQRGTGSMGMKAISHHLLLPNPPCFTIHRAFKKALEFVDAE